MAFKRFICLPMNMAQPTTTQPILQRAIIGRCGPVNSGPSLRDSSGNLFSTASEVYQAGMCSKRIGEPAYVAKHMTIVA